MSGRNGTGAPWLVAPAVGLAAFMEVLDLSIANVALRHIAGSFSASQDESTWVLTAYLVTNAIILPISGWLANRIGRKRYFIGCIAGFTVSSLLCGLAPSLWLLILFRALQGITGGGLQPSAQAILADSFPPEKRGLAFAAYGVAVVFAPAVGPVVGGYLTDRFSWHWIFLINVPVGVLLTILIARVVHEPPRPAGRLAGRGGLDYFGFTLLVVAMSAMQVVLDKGQEDDWFSSRFITTLAVTSLVALAGFVIWELRRDDPIVDLRLLGNRNFAVGCLLMFCFGALLLGSTVLLPILVQTLFGYTAKEAGLVLSPGGFVVMAMMPIVGRLTQRVDSRHLVAFGLTVSAVAALHLTGISLDADYGWFANARMLQAAGIAFLFVPVNMVAYEGLSPEKRNNATAMINTMRNLGGSIGIAVMTTILTRQAQSHQAVLVTHVTEGNFARRDFFAALTAQMQSGFASAADAAHHAQAVAYALVQKQATMLAFIDDFRFLALAMVAIVPLALLMHRQSRGKAPPAGEG